MLRPRPRRPFLFAAVACLLLTMATVVLGVAESPLAIATGAAAAAGFFALARWSTRGGYR